MKRGEYARQPALFDELLPVNDEPRDVRTRRLNRDRARRFRRRHGTANAAVWAEGESVNRITSTAERHDG